MKREQTWKIKLREKDYLWLADDLMSMSERSAKATQLEILLREREAEVKRELIKKIKKVKPVCGHVINGHTAAFCNFDGSAALTVKQVMLSLLAGIGDEECGCEADERGIKHKGKEHFGKGEEE